MVESLLRPSTGFSYSSPECCEACQNKILIPPLTSRDIRLPAKSLMFDIALDIIVSHLQFEL